MPDEGIGFIDVGVRPIKISSNEIEICVKNGIVTGRAQVVVKKSSKARPRGCDAVKLANVRRGK